MKNEKMKAFVYGLMLCILMPLVTSCARLPAKAERVQTTPPETLADPLPLPVYDGTTNEDLLNYCLDRVWAIKACNVDKGALDIWIQRQKKAP